MLRDGTMDTPWFAVSNDSGVTVRTSYEVLNAAKSNNYARSSQMVA
jgi:hypothetical protein